MKLLLISLTTAFLMSSCAHHHKDTPHHHHKKCNKTCKKGHDKEMFEKYCAQSVSEGDLHIKGKEDYKLEHAGHVYYFSSKKKLEMFKADINAQTKSAQRNWSERRR